MFNMLKSLNAVHIYIWLLIFLSKGATNDLSWSIKCQKIVKIVHDKFPELKVIWFIWISFSVLASPL